MYQGKLSSKMTVPIILWLTYIQDSKVTLKLCDLVICVDGEDDTVQNWHLSGMHLVSDFDICAGSSINCFKAVMSQSGNLVNTGEKLAFHTDKVSTSYTHTCTI